MLFIGKILGIASGALLPVSTAFINDFTTDENRVKDFGKFLHNTQLLSMYGRDFLASHRLGSCGPKAKKKGNYYSSRARKREREESDFNTYFSS